MRTVFLSIILLISFSSFGKKYMLISYILESETIDPELHDEEAVFEFNLDNISYKSGETIQYSIDDKVDTYTFDENRRIIIKTTPGNHKFQFYYNSYHNEIYTGIIPIGNKTRAIYRLLFTKSITSPSIEKPILYTHPEKPVIYLYPEKDTEVEVQIDIEGKCTFMYPTYNDGWKFTASPSGELTFGTNTYNYLFWESEQISEPLRSLDGFIVNKTSIISFFEEKLSSAGLTSKEQADFITYWGPRLMAHENCFIHFNFNETCNKYASLNITPKPNNLYRIYIEWYPVDQIFNTREQKIPTINRDGFTVLEWGGIELPPIVRALSTNTPVR
ncbi:MAG: hypothetical protein MK066_05475 [Crocinitomicaceae bacterium]|nr:hypothetical protein [Crocinitomicaceae bacterium]